jgi:hypothetical protein
VEPPDKAIEVDVMGIHPRASLLRSSLTWWALPARDGGDAVPEPVPTLAVPGEVEISVRKDLGGSRVQGVAGA